MANPNTILLKGTRNQEEYKAGGTIKPGHLIRKTSTGTVVVHATAAGYAQRMFALENELVGKTIDDNYATDETVSVHMAKPNDEIYGLLAAGVNAANGITLVSNGDGTLKLVTGSEKDVVAYADEGVDNSAGGSAVRIRIRVA